MKEVRSISQPLVETPEVVSEELNSDSLKMLADIGAKFLKNSFEKEKKETEVLDVAVVVNPNPLTAKPKRVIFEIKGVVEDDHMYNGAYIPGKIVGKHGFRLVQQVTNTNTTFDRENDFYITGLEPEFYENLQLSEEVLKHKLEEIRLAKGFLEKRYGNKSLSPRNYKFWENIRFSISDIGLVYDTHKPSANANEDQMLLYYVLLSGGCEDVALSYEDAKSWGKMFYLTVKEEETNRNFSGTKTKLEANSQLKDIMDNWSKEDILYLLYALPTDTNHGMHLNTPRNGLITEIDDFVEGKNFKVDKKKKSEIFVETVKAFEESKDLIKVKGLFNAAIYFGFITENKKNREFVNRLTGFNYGSTKETAIEKLLSLKNADELADIKLRVTKKWST